MTVKQLIKGLKKYRPHLQVEQGGVVIKAMRISESIRGFDTKVPVVRLIRQDEKRA